MFAQVIQGPVSDEAEIRAALQQWMQELAPGADGWLGSTAGVSEDGQFIAIARFSDADAAARNSDRPEQSAWWTQTSKIFTADPTFTDSADIVLDVIGNPDEAKFVQIIQGRGADPERARELMQQDSAQWATFRPDMLGSVAIYQADNAYTMVLYFTSEEEARAGETKEMPPNLKAQMDEMNAMAIGEPTFVDLLRPIVDSPR